MPIPSIDTDTDTDSDVTAAGTSHFMLLCVRTEQACVVRVCMKTLKVTLVYQNQLPFLKTNYYYRCDIRDSVSILLT